MIQLFVVLFATLSMVFSSPLQAQQVQQTSEQKRVAKIEIIANQLAPGSSFDANAVRARLKTKVGDFFNQADFNIDLKALHEEYRIVESSTETINQEIYITLKVWPKPLIKAITWVGNDKISTEKLEKELDVSVGSPFDEQTFNKAFHKLKAYYVKKGYFEAEMSFKPIFDPTVGEVDIEITIKEGRSGRIRELVFTGFTSDEEDDLVDMINTKTYNMFTSWFTDAGTYQAEVMERDKLLVLNFLHDRGFADASVEIKITEAPRPERIDVEITAQRGELYTCGEITFKGNKIFTDEQIEKHFTIRPGKPYSPEKVRETVHAITDFYGERGYIETTVSYEAHLQPGTLQYTLQFQINEGEQFRIGLLKIFGNSYTETRVILHECLMIPGEVFDIRKLKATEEKLQNIGYFKHVNVYAVKSPEKSVLGSNYRDVYIEVEETSTGHFSVFFGFSTLDSIFGGVEIIERNFSYKGSRNVLDKGPQSLRGGGEYARMRINIGSKMSSYLVSWTKPYFMDTPWIVGFDVEKSSNRRQSKDYEIDSLGLTTHATYPINAFLRTGWHYRVQDNTISVSPSVDPLIRQEAANSGVVSATGVSLAYDSTDHPSKPRKGFRSEIETEFAGLGGDFSFLGLAYVNSYYIPLHKQGILRFRADARFIQPLGSTTALNMPLGEKLYLGGETTVRGYRGYGIGPKFPNGDPRGGLTSALLSEEYRLSITKKIDVFAFLDAGSVSDKTYHFSMLRYSCGFGLCIEILDRIPITVGIGFPLNAADRSDIRRFFFSIGGHF